MYNWTHQDSMLAKSISDPQDDHIGHVRESSISKYQRYRTTHFLKIKFLEQIQPMPVGR